MNYMIPRVVCADGFSFSVQGGYGLYSSYNDIANAFPGASYEELEIGGPSAADSLIQEYAENPNNPKDTVYAWVPVATVAALVAKHGGLDKSYVQSNEARLFNYLSPYLAVHQHRLRAVSE